MGNNEILHVVECFSGGVYDFIVSLVNGLPEFNHTILYGKRENFKEDFYKDFSKNTSFIDWENATREINLKKDFLAGKELYKLLSRKNFQKIHLHSSKAGFIGRVIGRLKQQHNKIIYTTHGVSFLRQDVSEIKNKVYILFEKIGMYMGGKIIACSKSEAEFMKEKGIKKADYIFNGIDNIKNISTPKKNNIINIVTIGRITYQKNPELFNEIAKKFLNNNNIKFTWIGDGELKPLLKSNNINVTGWLEQKEVLKELALANIYISTSLWEGLSLAALQAKFLGIPLVLTECVGNIDLIKDGAYTLDFFLKNNIEKILKENREYKINKVFFKSEMLKKYKKLYQI